LADHTKFLQVARGLLDPSDASGIPLCVRAFDDYYSAHVQPFLAVCAKLGDDGTALGKQVERAWGQQRDVLVTASQCKEPKDQSALKDLIAPLAASMKEINAAIKRNPFENNVKTVFEGAPMDFMTSYIDGSDMWSNRIRKEYKVTFLSSYAPLID
jgi:hypothetical protein